MPTPDLLTLAPGIHADLQRIVDLMARLAEVPVGLINCRDGDHLEVGVAGGDGNPPRPGTRLPLAAPGVFCETVIRTGESLLVPNALRDGPWRDDPSFVPQMVSYLGYPVRDPDGNVLGTICVMDRRERHLTPPQVELVEQMRNLVERHLALAWLNAALGDRNRGVGDYRREITTLRDLIPICSGCKSVRDDAGYWQAVETWIADRSGAAFTHGICPECVHRLYPELEDGASTGT
ncbi:MAG: GAF domain-containing protein [Krumholzibacteria bacterium]|nr:GAF domain-containing protein [Candidatus Krumholzibacteria bacterium]